MSEHATQLTDHDQLQRRNRELSILNAIAEALNREVDLHTSLHTALAKVVELFGLHSGWIWLLDEHTRKPYLAVVQDLPPALANVPERMDGSLYCHCLDTYQSGTLDGAANIDIVTCTRLKGLVDGTDGLRYHASIPLFAHGKSLGILNVASTDWRELSLDDLRLLYTVGDLLSMAIERARLFERSVQLGALEERNRLAREIHDTLAQGLTAISLQLEAADVLLEAFDANSERIRHLIRRALELTRVNLEEARRSVFDLRAAHLEGHTLAEAIKKLVDELARKHGFELWLNFGENRALPPRIESGLYRITQEALTNITRHAQARRVKVSLMTLPDRVELAIDDDGRGFDPETINEGRFGLIGVNERVRLLGGTLELCSAPGEGTRLEVVVPLQGKS